MAALIDLTDATAWIDTLGGKVTLVSLDTALLSQLTSEIQTRLSGLYTTSTWTSSSNTPVLIKKILAMQYVGWHYQKVFSTDNDLSNYGTRLIEASETLLASITSGTLLLPDVIAAAVPNGTPVFYPTDASSAQEATIDNPSFGGPVFTLGQIW